MTPRRPQLSLRGIVRRYGAERQWFALRDASLDVYAGDFLAITGPSGSGKSTLLNVMGLLDDEWDGHYEIDGLNVRDLSSTQRDGLRAEAFGFVFQSSYANPFESTSRNASLGMAIQGATLEQQNEAVTHSLGIVGLAHKSDSLARLLSGGERQRLAIARAIATGPRVILADEPTGNLDSMTAVRVMELLRDLNRSGATIIVVTHDPSVATYADRVVEVKDGMASSSVKHTATTLIRAPDDQPEATPTKGGSGSVAPAPPIGRGSNIGRALRVAQERASRAINNITSRPLRSFALVAAFAVAIAGMVAAAGVAASASQQIADRLTQAALDEVRVSIPAELSDEARAGWISTLRGLEHVLDVGEVAPLDASQANTTRFPLRPQVDGSTFNGTTLALDAAALALYEVTTAPSAAGMHFERDGRVALVGQDIAESLGVQMGSFGAEIWVAGRPYAVTGVITEAARAPNLRTSVVVPIDALQDPPVQLVVRTDPGFSAAVAEAVPLALSPAAPAEVGVSTTGDLRNLRIGVSTDLNGLLNSVAVALLILAVLSASSAMFLSVQSRIQELALSRALGLSRFGVASVFIWEGIIVGFAGSLAGVSVGLSFAVAVAAVREWTAVVPWATLAIAPVVGVVCGALSALLPALRASRIDPADAIR